MIRIDAALPAPFLGVLNPFTLLLGPTHDFELPNRMNPLNSPIKYNNPSVMITEATFNRCYTLFSHNPNPSPHLYDVFLVQCPWVAGPPADSNVYGSPMLFLSL